MDLKGVDEKEMIKGYNDNSLFGESSDLVDHHHHDLLQHKKSPSSASLPRARNSDPDQGPESGQRIRRKPTGLSLKSLSISGATGATRYRECLRNHAASAGRNVLDGCGEFMPAGDEGTLEALKCAACNCHRNFHRKEADDMGFAAMVRPLQLPSPLPLPLQSPFAKQHNRHWNASIVPPVKIAFGGGRGSGGTDSSSEDLNFNAFHSSTAQAGPPPPFFVLSKKRFRTKFTQEQKEKMLEFAEKVGWRIPREDDAEAQRFCAEVGVKRRVLKVWMHNNKIAKKQTQQEDN